ncbi:MAG: hypothetical protein ACI86M_001252 [Saprospiraceae bacterium]|jgi:hypothetical protein
MYEDHRFSKLVKYLFFFSIVFAIVQIIYFTSGRFGTPSSPYEEAHSIFDYLLDNIQPLSFVAVTWISIWFITKDLLSSSICFMLSQLAWYYAVSQIGPVVVKTDLIILFTIILLSLPYALFGVLHFKTARGLYLLGLPLLGSGLQISSYPIQLNNLQSHPNVTFVLDSFDIVSIQNSSIFATIFTAALFLINSINIIISVTIFQWLYDSVKSKTNPLVSLQKLYLNTIDRLSYSIIFWSLNLYLCVISFCLVEFTNSATLSLYSTFLIISSCFGIFVIASLYRNFLVSRFVYLGQYPTDLYYFLNLPFLNILAWLYSLLFLFKSHDEYEPIMSPDLNGQEVLKSKFLFERRNYFWKNVTMLGALTIFSLVFMKYRHRISPQPVDISWTYPYLIAGVCIVCYLYFKKVFHPLSILLILYVVFHGFHPLSVYLKFNVPSLLIYLTVFYGFFHFDDLHWDIKRTD